MHYRNVLLALLSSFITVTSGCHIPAPTIREYIASPTLSAPELCREKTSTAHFALKDHARLLGILECSDEKAVVVILNEFNVRVRTITVTKSAAIRDEHSYLSPMSETADTVLAALQNSLRRNKTRGPDASIEILQLTRFDGPDHRS
jgi:hypothetical protein